LSYLAKRKRPERRPISLIGMWIRHEVQGAYKNSLSAAHTPLADHRLTHPAIIAAINLGIKTCLLPRQQIFF